MGSGVMVMSRVMVTLAGAGGSGVIVTRFVGSGSGVMITWFFGIRAFSPQGAQRTQRRGGTPNSKCKMQSAKCKTRPASLPHGGPLVQQGKGVAPKSGTSVGTGFSLIML